MSKRNLRRFSQALFLFLFLFLFFQTESKGNDTLGYPVKLFLDFNPLIFITTVLSTHAKNIPSAFFLSIILILITIPLGRVFCGWVCPLGTINNIFSSFRKKYPIKIRKNWHKIKYYLFISILVSSIFTLQLAGLLDPMSLLIRSLSLSIYPLTDYALRETFDMIYNTDTHGIVNVSESIYNFLKQNVLSFHQPFYFQGIFIGLIFFTIVGLNFFEKRFWCKYICPLGALLGLLSKYAIVKREVSEGCTSCSLCSTACQGEALKKGGEEWRKTECLVCFNCDDICPANAVKFGFRKNDPLPINLGRRKVMLSMASGILTVPLIRSTPFSKLGFSEPFLLRPPGALEEREFLKRCVKCGECMKVCITNGLQPTFLEAGLEGIWSPRLVPSIGYCEYRCTLCGQVCPTGAIQKLSLQDKMNVRIGLAMIDKGRCLPYAHRTSCIVCEEVCPTPTKAIWLEEVVVRDRSGKEIFLKQPHVDLNLCIGCGICEAKCPVGSKPAIYVTNTGESRAKTNQILI